MTASDSTPYDPAWLAISGLISDISEDFYCAGWMENCEFDVWRLIHEGGTYGMGSADQIPEELGALRSLANHLGVWVRWGVDGPEPVPLSVWEPRYAEWKQKRDDWQTNA